MKVPSSDNASNSNADGDSRVPWISKRVLGGEAPGVGQRVSQ
jgi:hypothetical protein